VGTKCVITGATLRHSMLGNEVVVRNFKGSGTIGDHSEMIGD
jgi:hypothetical protein